MDLGAEEFGQAVGWEGFVIGAPLDHASIAPSTAPLDTTTFKQGRDARPEQVGHFDIKEVGDEIEVATPDAAVASEDFREPGRRMTAVTGQFIGSARTCGQ